MCLWLNILRWLYSKRIWKRDTFFTPFTHYFTHFFTHFIHYLTNNFTSTHNTHYYTHYFTLLHTLHSLHTLLHKLCHTLLYTLHIIRHFNTRLFLPYLILWSVNQMLKQWSIQIQRISGNSHDYPKIMIENWGKSS